MVIHVEAKPNASKTEIISFQENTLKIKIAAPAVDDKANKQLVAFLSKQLKIPKSKIIIAKGNTSRHKKVDIDIQETSLNEFLNSLQLK
ncbi:MAG: DUF167 domain-containing protein [Bacteroidia bacterium]